MAKSGDDIPKGVVRSKKNKVSYPISIKSSLMERIKYLRDVSKHRLVLSSALEPYLEEIVSKLEKKYGIDKFDYAKKGDTIKSYGRCQKDGCDGELVLRSSKNSIQFLGCSNFPKCDFTKDLKKK